ncbi:MAG: hypothetical protein RIT27_1652 [Pseudomonadota bacterium]|jgi:undecaprenyl phosphate-alpha-L-ara4FN deformylase
MLKVGLRIDVDTFDGTKDGVPYLLDILQHYDIKASFFFSMGPDNMGRHLWRLLRPAFLLKMFRSKAASLYGWEILKCGTFWSGKQIAQHLPHIIQNTANQKHEIGFHAWDHHAWQMKIDRFSSQEIYQSLENGIKAFEKVGVKPTCSAVAGWRANEITLIEKEKFNFHYNSDCRGESIFLPIIEGKNYTPQIPVTLPTYDEIIGNNGINDSNYNDYLISLFQPDTLNVLTIHAEVEGRSRRQLFEDFLNKSKIKNIQFVPLGDLLPPLENIPTGHIERREFQGREGWLCCQTKP